MALPLLVSATREPLRKNYQRMKDCHALRLCPFPAAKEKKRYLRHFQQALRKLLESQRGEQRKVGPPHREQGLSACARAVTGGKRREFCWYWQQRLVTAQHSERQTVHPHQMYMCMIRLAKKYVVYMYKVHVNVQKELVWRLVFGVWYLCACECACMCV